jgi:hypothetical protein
MTDTTLAAYYTYPVAFVPTGVAAQRYEPIASGTATVDVSVDKAQPLLGATPQGTSIYSIDSGHPQPLSASIITGDVYFMRGSSLVRIAGTRSEEHTSELQSPYSISYAVFCL